MSLRSAGCGFRLARQGCQQFLRPVSDQIHAAGGLQGLNHILPMVRQGRLQQRALPPFFLFIRNMDRFHGQRIQSGMVHDSRQRAGRRIKILHLFRHPAFPAQKQGQINGLLQRVARMPGHQVRNQVLAKSELLIDRLIAIAEVQIDSNIRFAHGVQYGRADMLGCDFELSADMVPAQFCQEVRIAICHQRVIADARADENLADARPGANLAQQRQ